MRVFALVGNACCVPVEFLSDEQSAAFGQYSGELPQSEIERFFYLDGAARDLIGLRRGAHYQLGFALQLGTVRFLGTFLSDPLAVPAGVLGYIAAQPDVLRTRRWLPGTCSGYRLFMSMRVRSAWCVAIGTLPGRCSISSKGSS